MRIIYRIAKLELSNLFYSPVAWLVLIVFAFQAGFQFTTSLGFYDAAQQIGQQSSNMTAALFVQGMGGGLLSEMLHKLYLYMPLLTMGLMSRETSSGSIKLLLSSPVKTSEIIWGKFAAMMAYGLILILVLFLFGVAASFSIPFVDWGLLCSGLLGVYMLICAYAAIGLLMSCLTSYQVVAAISTLVVLAALNYVKFIGQKIDFLRDITYYLSITGRSDQMLSGLISSRDMLYYIIVIGLFLGLSMLKLFTARESKPFSIQAGRYALLLGSVCLLVYLSSRPAFTLYADMTADDSRTLTPNSRQILQSLKGPVTITTYDNLLADKSNWALPQNRNNDLLHFENYSRFLPDIKMKYVYYYDTSKLADQLYFKQYPNESLEQIAKRVARANDVDPDLFLTPAEIRKQIDLKPEDNSLVRQVEVGGKKTFLRMYDDISGYPGETEISSAFKRFLVTPPMVAFLTGHNERSINREGDTEFKTPTKEGSFRQSLINQGFDVEELSIADKDVPANVSLLVLADPRMTITTAEQARIEAFIARGGNMLIAGEPGRQELLNPILATLGLQLMPGRLIQLSKDNPADYALTYISEPAKAMAPGFRKISAYNLGAVSMPGAAAISYSAAGTFEKIPLLVTKDSSNSWNKAASLDLDSIQPEFSREAGDTAGVFVTTVALRRKVGNKEQRIIVCGDADFMNNYEIFRRSTGNFYRINFYFYGEMCRWLGNDEFPVDVSRPDPKDVGLNIDSAGIGVMKIIFLVVLPIIILLAGTVLLIKRRRQ
jgi:ABC-2 type transport system permease protein